MELLHTVFYCLLNMSAVACLLILPLMALRRVRALPRRAAYALWLLPLLRLTVPFAPESPFSLYGVAEGLVKRSVPMDEMLGAPVPVIGGMTASNVFGAAAQYRPVTYADEGTTRLFATLAVVWVSVAATLLVVAAVLYVVGRRALVQSGVTAPVLVGVLRPQLLLPQGFDRDSDEGRMILAHEEIHRRRGDNGWRAVAICVACVHWFNPLVWLTLPLCFADLEGACDEAVLRTRPPEQRGVYAAALLRYAEAHRTAAASPFGGTAKTRILHVLRYKKLTTAGAVLATVFLLALAAIVLTNPQLRG